MNDTLTVAAEHLRDEDQVRIQDDWYTVEGEPKVDGDVTHLTLSRHGRFNCKAKLFTKVKYTIKARI